MNDEHEQPAPGQLYATSGWCAPPLTLPDIQISRGPLDWRPKPAPTRRQRLVRKWRKLRDRVHAVRAVWADPDRLA